MDTFLHDVRYGARTLWRSPGFTAVAVLALALGIGANSAIFSFVNATLIRNLPFSDPDRLVVLWEVSSNGEVNEASALDYLDWRAQAESVEDMAAWVSWGRTLTGGSEPEQIDVVRASPSLFSVLGVEPRLGRAFTADEDVEGRNTVVILSHWFWQRRFGGDPAIVGRTVTLDGATHTVIGVMPASFRFPDEDAIAMWMPLTYLSHERRFRRVRMFNVIGRLASGTSIDEARAELQTISARLADQHPESNTGWSAELAPARAILIGPNPLLLILLGAVGFVLLIACANVASLLLARAADRSKEIAIRTALGAGRIRLVRQMLAESVLLALLGAAVGLVLAVWSIDMISALDPGHFPRWNAFDMDVNVLVFTGAICVLTALLAGLVPALQASSPDLSQSLKEGSGRATSGSRSLRVRSVIVVMEVALSLVLLVGAGLLINTFYQLNRVRPGFNPQNLLVAWLDLPETRYPDDEEIVRFFEDVLLEVRAISGVQSAAFVTTLPMSPVGSDYDLEVSIEGVPGPETGAQNGDFRVVSDDYFRTLGVPLLMGRSFDSRDEPEAIPVVIVNETFVRRFLSDVDPVGKVVILGDDGDWRVQIVGVVGDVKHRGLDAAPRPEMFVPQTQIYAHNGMNLVVRTQGDPLSYVDAVKRRVYAIDADQPVAEIATMGQLLDDSVARKRFNMLLLGSLAAIGLILASTGIYSVIAYSVARRTQEIGIRMAIGARANDVLALMVFQGMRLAAIGLVVGLAGAFVLTRLLNSLLFGVTATDPATFALVSALLMIVALGASYVPARRATRVDPITALRSE